MRKILDLLGIGKSQKISVEAIRRRSGELAALSDEQLKAAAGAVRVTLDVTETFALTSSIAEHVLGMRMFGTQLSGALAMQRGHIAEMQTGEGKTLAAVPAVIWYALHGRGIHVLTANDYLARRDAQWMGEVYRWFGLTVAHLSQGMSSEERRGAYLADVLYATANEVGFDFLRDGLAQTADELVQRNFAFALIDEADSILIDEARIPLVIAGGEAGEADLAGAANAIATVLRPVTHFAVDEYSRNVRLTDRGIDKVERAFNCGSLYDEKNLGALTAVQDALHAHALLKRDVDYVIRDGAIELVDEFKGRVAQDRRWPAGLQSALEAKEGIAPKRQGRVLGSITVQNLIGMYERVCGMTGTAATQAEEFWKVYKLPVTVIPTNRPVIRQDLPDIVYADRAARDRALLREIENVRDSGRPILVGTASVEDSERLSRRLHARGVPHSVLNARNDQAEAAIVARAGEMGAVTISTNMAGRGTDILLGDGVVAVGGLYVIGTTRHEARRIDNQLRGRAGRQGDPGSSRFLISHEDDLLVRYGVSQNADIDSVQRTIESQNLEIRQTLWKYEAVIETHRRDVYKLRRELLLERNGHALDVLDDLWADYLANVSELRGGIHWVAWGGRDPLFEFIHGVQDIYADLLRRFEEELAEPRPDGVERFERGATWTYLTSDQPFGNFSERFVKGLKRRLSER